MLDGKKVKFTILICHLPDRKSELNRLLAILDPQLNDDVEVIVDDGEGHVGAKRNRLIEKSRGEYVAFIDDDDVVQYNYVELILREIEFLPDCVGITGIYRRKGVPDWTFRHSITVNRWCRDKRNKVYFRTPNHLNPIKRDIVTQVMFNSSLDWGEDRDFSDRIRPRIKTERYIETPVYIYLAR